MPRPDWFGDTCPISRLWLIFWRKVRNVAFTNPCQGVCRTVDLFFSTRLQSQATTRFRRYLQLKYLLRIFGFDCDGRLRFVEIGPFLR